MEHPGTKNLIPFSERTEEEQREIRSKGGKASGAARRAKANLRQAIETVLSAKLSNEKAAEQLRALGFKDTHEAAVAFAMVLKASKGDTRAFEAITKYLTTSKDKHDIAEQKQRIKAARLANEQAEEGQQVQSETIVIVDNWREDDGDSV